LGVGSGKAACFCSRRLQPAEVVGNAQLVRRSFSEGGCVAPRRASAGRKGKMNKIITLIIFLFMFASCAVDEKTADQMANRELIKYAKAHKTGVKMFKKKPKESNGKWWVYEYERDYDRRHGETVSILIDKKTGKVVIPVVVHMGD
jgi:hypothetical protein